MLITPGTLGLSSGRASVYVTLSSELPLPLPIEGLSINEALLLILIIPLPTLRSPPIPAAPEPPSALTVPPLIVILSSPRV